MKRLASVLIMILFCVFMMMPSQTAAATKDDGNPDGGTLNFGEYGRPATLDPITSNDMISVRVIELLFNGLVGIDEKQEIVAELAERWEIAEEGKIYTFYLRQDVT